MVKKPLAIKKQKRAEVLLVLGVICFGLAVTAAQLGSHSWVNVAVGMGGLFTVLVGGIGQEYYKVAEDE